MSRRFLFFRVVLLVVLASGLTFGQILPESIRQKLHPAFRALFESGIQSLAFKPTPSPVASTGVISAESRYPAIISTTNVGAVRAMGIHVNSVVGKYVTALLTSPEILQLAQSSDVQYLDPGATLHTTLDVSVPEIGAKLLHGGFLNNSPYKGKGVIVLIIDTGIDWRHLDFRNPTDTTRSRIISIWDQTLAPVGGEISPSGFNYGVEYFQNQINAELGSTPPKFVREQDNNGHGTHVAGIAAGNGAAFFQKYVGVAPEADIIVVKASDQGSLSETKIIDGLTYAANKSAEMGEPVVVNLSAGAQYGTHNGTSPSEAAINTFVSVAGRVMTVSAGNDAYPIHIDGTVSSGSTSTITFSVPSYTPNPGTNNDRLELDVWFDSGINVTSTVTSPSGVTVTGSGSAANQSDGSIDVANGIGSNGNRTVQIVLSDQSTSVPRTGTWTLRFTGASGAASYSAWLSTYLIGAGNSLATISGGNSQMTVGMPGTAAGAITVGSYVTKSFWTSYNGTGWAYNANPAVGSISSFSSIGPTADGRQKPEIAAPGQGIASALSSALDTSAISTRIMPGLKYWLIEGTSMAAPHVAGVAAIMLQARPTLSASQVKSNITSTARTDGFVGAAPNPAWGFGKIDAFRAVAKAVGATGAASALLNYASSSAFYTLLPSTNLKFAVRFTPTISGKLASVAVLINGGANGIKGSGSLKVSAAQNVTGSVAGIPGAQIGTSISTPFRGLAAGSWNNVDMSSANVSVTNGVDFQVIVEVAGTVGDTLQFLLDDGTTSGTNRTSSYRSGVNGLAWYNRADPNYLAGRAPSYENLLLTATIASVAVGVEKTSSTVPASFQLFENYPNPFNPTTTIRYALPASGPIRLRIFDVIGREVASLINENQSAGTYAVEWRGTDNNGNLLSSGVYFYRLEASGIQMTKKMLLLK